MNCSRDGAGAPHKIVRQRGEELKKAGANRLIPAQKGDSVKWLKWVRATPGGCATHVITELENYTWEGTRA